MKTHQNERSVHVSAKGKSTGDVVFDIASAEFFHFDIIFHVELLNFDVGLNFNVILAAIFDVEHVELLTFGVIFNVISNAGLINFGHRCYEHMQ